MRVVAGSALVVRAGLTLRSDPPPMNVTIPAILLLGAGILLIAGLWTPIAGTSVGLTEVWKMLTPPGNRPLWLMLATTGVALAIWVPGYGPSMLAFMAGSASNPHLANKL